MSAESLTLRRIEMTEKATHSTQVGTVIVPVSDQNRALEFYLDKLEFEKRVAPHQPLLVRGIPSAHHVETDVLVSTSMMRGTRRRRSPRELNKQ
jgi:hypothetical protein